MGVPEGPIPTGEKGQGRWAFLSRSNSGVEQLRVETEGLTRQIATTVVQLGTVSVRLSAQTADLQVEQVAQGCRRSRHTCWEYESLSGEHAPVWHQAGGHFAAPCREKLISGPF